MSSQLDLYWLPEIENWNDRLRAVRSCTDQNSAWSECVALASGRMDFVRTQHLDRALQAARKAAPPATATTQHVRLAILSSSTNAHLLPAIRVAGCRRNLPLETYAAPYGQIFSELADEKSKLYAFGPTAILIAFDARTLFPKPQGGETRTVDQQIEEAFLLVTNCWDLARNKFGGIILQQTVLPVFSELLGNNEHRYAQSRNEMVAHLNMRLRLASDGASVDLIDVARFATAQGINAWHQPKLWFAAKQEIAPDASPYYGELVARVIAARLGLSKKCLVLDLDNTLWGGVIGDDGLAGIALGQGNAEGEAFLAFQEFAHQLSMRGIILAVCSKNDDANARLPFTQHSEMALRNEDISCFVANWDDKASNIRRIAQTLNIGLDSLVFFDDNPFERNLVRAELPMVAVPEVPADASDFVRCLADAGYFESCGLTSEDASRTQQYAANERRLALQTEASDMGSYLANLQMRMLWGPISPATLPRSTQLINKTNQFNLTTKRYTQDEVDLIAANPSCLALQFRLVDRYGDNGLIAVVLCTPINEDGLQIDTWLMSCRVLKRGVEQAMLQAVINDAASIGSKYLIGEYRPTAKNEMVKSHYADLGFDCIERYDDGSSKWLLNLANYQAIESPISSTRC